MNIAVEYEFSEEDKKKAEVIAKNIKALVSISAMRSHTELLRKYPKINQMPTSFIGLFYIFFTIIHSCPNYKEYFINNAKITRGIIRDKELSWIELNGWFIYADGMTRIDIGLVDEVEYKLVESFKALDIYEAFFREDSRIRLFTDEKV